MWGNDVSGVSGMWCEDANGDEIVTEPASGNGSKKA